MTSDIATLSDRRIFFLGVNTGFVIEGCPDHRYLDFYARRSSPDLYCAIVGNVVVPGGHGSNAVAPTLTTDPIWSDLAAVIRSRGSLPGIQLATAWEGYRGVQKFVGARPIEVISQARDLTAAMGTARVTTVLERFEDAAAMAVAHGFGHVQIHAAHGYLLSLLIDERLHPDAARVRDKLSTLSKRLRASNVETSIRISLRTGEKTLDSGGAAAFQDAVARLPFDYVDLSSGFYNIDKRLIYPTRPDVLEARLADSIAVGARHPSRAFILSGHTLRHDWTHRAHNLHLGLCRDLIANPDVLKDQQNGCMNLNKCHYFSRGEPHLTCGRWSD